MAYRDEHTCHVCGEKTHRVCPSCGNGVCVDHTLQQWFPDDNEMDDNERAAAQRLAKRLGGVDACSQCVEQEIEESERAQLVTVMRTGDPIQAQMIAEGLQSEGLDARTLGTQHAALLGAGQCIFEQRIEVPETQAERALALIKALTDGRHAEETDDDEGEEEAAVSGPRSRTLTVGFVMAAALAIIYALAR